MESPQTPKKTKRVNDIIEDLNDKWKLRLPVHDSYTSPSQSVWRSSVEGQILKRIQILFWKDRSRLEEAIGRFQDFGATICTDPSCALRNDPSGCSGHDVSNSKREQSMRLTPLEWEDWQLKKLKDKLLLELGGAVEAVSKHLMSRVPTASSTRRKVARDASPTARFSKSFTESSDLEADALEQNTRLGAEGVTNLTTRIAALTTVRPVFGTYQKSLASIGAKGVVSDEFGPDLELSDFQRAEDQMNATYQLRKERRRYSATSQSNDSTEERFHTPPGMPAPGFSSDNSISSDEGFQIPSPTDRCRGRKRISHHSDNDPLASPKKVTRTQRFMDSCAEVPKEEARPSRTSSNDSFRTSAITPSSTAETLVTSRVSTANTSFASTTKVDLRPSADLAQAAMQLRAEDSLRMHIISNLDPNTVPRSQGLPSNSILATDSDHRFNLESYFNLNVISNSLFPQIPPIQAKNFSFRMVYEATRVSLHTGLPESKILEQFSRRRMFDEQDVAKDQKQDSEHGHKQSLQQNPDCSPNHGYNQVYDDIWSVLGGLVKDYGELPEPTSEAAWNAAAVNATTGKGSETVGLSGDLEIDKKPWRPLFRLKLKPLRIEPPCRLTRKFGGNRLFVLNFHPSIFEPSNLPDILKGHAAKLRELFVDWITGHKHRFLGRTWSFFFVREQERKRHSRGSKFRTDKSPIFRLFFFALDEHQVDPTKDFSNTIPMRSIEDFLDWAIEPELNQYQPVCKLFSRIQLVLSSTSASHTFEPWQILKADNAYSDNPAVWKIDQKRSTQKKNNPRLRLKKASEVSVMNDGCARLSQQAAAYITEILGLRTIPSAFQGRIAGAKGMWMVDASNDKLPPAFPSRNVWIELNDEQTKFETSAILCERTRTSANASKLTFEVLAYVKPLSNGVLNTQILTVLLARGVPTDVFLRLLHAEITEFAEKLKAAMRSSRELLTFIQSRYSVKASRAMAGGVEWVGGLPFARLDRLMWLLASGFEPAENCLVVELCRRLIKQHQDRLVEKMNICIGKSTNAFILADPLNVLKEDECFLSFSTPLYNPNDPNPVESLPILHGREILVARSPVMQPSDIWKVRVMMYPELTRYQDVLIFSSQGEVPLASRLSGGDYDGDKVWICWEPAIVSKFSNCVDYHIPKPENYFGMEKKTLTYADLRSDTDCNSVQEFLRQGLSFNLAGSMVGHISTYHEAYVYGQTISHNGKVVIDDQAKDMATLFGYEIDKAKSGLIFGSESWDLYKKRVNLPATIRPPAYKTSDDPRLAEMNHPIDFLVFKAKRMSDEVLTEYQQHRNLNPSNYDSELAGLIQAERQLAREDTNLKLVLEDLDSKLKALTEEWTIQMSQFRLKEEIDERFQRIVNSLRDRFLRIKPLEETSPIARRWLKECSGSCNLATRGSWRRLKASALFAETYNRSPAVWWICGRELAAIKAESLGDFIPITRSTYDVMKVDTKLVEQLEAKRRSTGTVTIDKDDGLEDDSEDDSTVTDWETAFGSFHEERDQV